MTSQPEAIEPDTKDWTWTLHERCPECGFKGSDVAPDEVAPLIAQAMAPWADVLARPDVRERPAPTVWSPLEYACHVMDVGRVFDGRLALMLAEDDPEFENWDQDETALRGHYGEQDPASVASGLAASGRQLSERYAGVAGEQWQRTGRRSNGSVFTVLSLGQYCLHDLTHHLVDVGARPAP